MRCITIRPPWSLLVADGRKDIENRPRRTKIRGDVLIHSGKRYDKGAEPRIIAACKKLGLAAPTMEEMRNAPRSAIIGVMRIRDCVEKREVARESRAWASGPFCYLLEQSRVFAQPIPWSGQLGFFEVPERVVARALKSAKKKRQRRHSRP